MKQILITGATGVLGSELLYHLLFEKLVEKQEMKLSLVVRPSEELRAEERIKTLFNHSIIPAKLAGFSVDELVSALDVIEGNLANFAFEPAEKFTLIHSAAIVNLNHKEKTKELIIRDNYQATLSLVERFADKIEHMVFVSTAYSCGVIRGQVDNDYLSLKEEDLTFRNFYEEYKFKAEQEVNKLSSKYNFDLSIVRPSIISGRMLVEPHFVMKRYIVFYLMGKFFQESAKLGVPKDMLIRVQANKDVNLNVIPVDYVAKGIVRILRNPHIKQLNLVNSKPFPVFKIIEKSMEMNGFTNLHYVQEEPAEKTPLEVVFYKTVARQLVQYVDASHHTFDTRELRELLSDVAEPDINERFDELFEFAQQREYAN